MQFSLFINDPKVSNEKISGGKLLVRKFIEMQSVALGPKFLHFHTVFGKNWSSLLPYVFVDSGQ